MDTQCTSIYQTKTVALDTLGCKLNQAETEQLIRQLNAAGYTIVPSDQLADIYILNTCTVTHIADRKTRHLLRMAHRRNPEAKIIALGCYADRAAKELRAIEGVDLVLGNDEKQNLMQILATNNIDHSERISQDWKNADNRTRSFIKAQDGCNNFCTYCIVPLVRGREKSLTPENILNEIQIRIEAGYQEVVLTGTEIGRYESDGVDLIGLLEIILSRTSLKRLRLSSLQPQEINSGLIDLWKDTRLCRHFHLSLQSGSDSVLRRMNRKYSAEEYAESIRQIRSFLPEAGITTDIIVGFPGETETEFNESYNFSNNMRFSRIHVFPFSPREGTLAAQMESQIPADIKKYRLEKMLDLAAKSMQDYHRCSTGQVQNVLFEQVKNDTWCGYTDTYINVYADSKVDLSNLILPTKLIELHEDGMRGEVIIASNLSGGRPDAS